MFKCYVCRKIALLFCSPKHLWSVLQKQFSFRTFLSGTVSFPSCLPEGDKSCFHVNIYFILKQFRKESDKLFFSIGAWSLKVSCNSIKCFSTEKIWNKSNSVGPNVILLNFNQILWIFSELRNCFFIYEAMRSIIFSALVTCY